MSQGAICVPCFSRDRGDAGAFPPSPGGSDSDEEGGEGRGAGAGVGGSRGGEKGLQNFLEIRHPPEGRDDDLDRDARAPPPPVPAASGWGPGGEGEGGGLEGGERIVISKGDGARAARARAGASVGPGAGLLARAARTSFRVPEKAKKFLGLGGGDALAVAAPRVEARAPKE
jgi:hypothetical protein